MVAHSMAGPHAEALLRIHPERAEQVLGLVLVDASVDLRARPQRSQAAWLAAARMVHVLAAVPPLRLLGSAADRVLLSWQSGRRLRDPAEPVARALYRNRDAMASVVAEQAAYRAQLWDLELLRRERPWPTDSHGRTHRGWCRRPALDRHPAPARGDPRCRAGRAAAGPAHDHDRRTRRGGVRRPVAELTAEAQAEIRSLRATSRSGQTMSPAPMSMPAVGDPGGHGPVEHVLDERPHARAVEGVHLGQFGLGVVEVGQPDPFDVTVLDHAQEPPVP